MIEGLTDYLVGKGIGKVTELIGKAIPTLHETGEFDLGRQGIATYDLDTCVGCGQCHIVCHDAGGQALEWDSTRRRPRLIEEKCLSCMICSFVCPVPGIIGFKEKPKTWKRLPTPVMDEGERKRVMFEPFTMA
jgi:dihydropyrimidine dehydrogenase (NAD+) subunit PreA